MYKGMGAVFLHSAHHAKIMMKMLQDRCSLSWSHQDGVSETVQVLCPHHPIAKNIPQSFGIPNTELYVEPFTIGVPDDVVFSSVFSTGQLFRSGVTYTRGHGKIFYFSPGHESFPIYHQREVIQILQNAVRWTYNDSNAQIRKPVDRSLSVCPEIFI